MRTVSQLLVLITLVVFLTGCGEKPDASQDSCAGQKACRVINVKAPCVPAASVPVEAKPVETVPPPPAAEEPKVEKTPSAEPAKEASKEKGKLIIVTNAANYELDKDVINFIATRGVPIERVSPADFEKYKTEKYILVLGGPNDGDGLGGIVKELLSADEVNYVNQMGNRKLCLKTNKWSGDQYVLVIAGYDADATFRELVNGKDKWWGYISSWFNIELSHDEVYGY